MAGYTIYILFGFIVGAAMMSIVLAWFAAQHNPRIDTKDKFVAYYSPKTDNDDAELYVPKYKKLISGPMAEDMYRWLTK